jgi:L-glutamine:2-deoxy-scyllo-inosose/3-amino-2,3-dideoxy-scyllo-inosose aminotransferase
MAKLAIHGGTPVRTKPWPTWPQHTQRQIDLMLEVVKADKWSFDGPKEWEFQEKFAQFKGSKYALCVANGTVSLQLCLEALGIGAGDEVIVPGLTFQATAAACLDVNAVPTIVDVEPDTYSIDPKKAEEAITPRTKAIIPVHLYNCMADMDAIMDIAKRHNLFVVEDTAHQHGSFWKGKGAGAIGNLGSFSCQETKVLPSGEGGIILMSDRDLFLRVYSLRNCGRKFKDGEGENIQSGNFRITEFQAATLLAQFELLEERTKLRDERALYLNKRLAEIPGLAPMKRDPRVTRQDCYLYCFRYNGAHFKGAPRDAFNVALGKELGLGLWTPYSPLNNCDIYQPHTKPRYHFSEAHWKAIDPRRFSLPVAERAAYDEGVTLFHWLLLEEEKGLDSIVDACAKIHQNADELLSIPVEPRTTIPGVDKR